MNEIEVFQLLMKGLLSDLGAEELQEYKNYYDQVKVDSDSDQKKLAVIMFAMDLIKDQMNTQ